MEKKAIIPVILAISLVCLYLVSAFDGFGWVYSSFSPSDLLQNEWVFFSLIFVIFFALVFFSLGKAMKENKGAAAVISLAISFILAAIVSQRASYYGYVGEELANWILLTASIIIIIFFILFMSRINGLILMISLGLIWFGLHTIEVSFLPYEVTSSDIYPYYEFFIGNGGIIFLAVIFLIMLIACANKGFRKWFLGTKGKPSLRDLLAGES